MSSIASMTGFASVSAEGVSISAKSVNSRYLDLNFRLVPKVEQTALKAAKSMFSRGRIELFVEQDRSTDTGLFFDAKRFEQTLAQVKAFLGEAESDSAVGVVLKECLSREPHIDDSVFEELISSVFSLLQKDREREGAEISKELKKYRTAMYKCCHQLEQISKKLPKEVESKVKEKLENLSTDERAASELAYLIEKSDISEEVVRLRVHLDEVEKTIAAGGVIGRRLDFLAQEIGRETNTIGSKSSNPETSALVVDLKTELEKFREQVQNIE